MSQSRFQTEVIEREGDGYVSLCPELDIASQGATVEEARHGRRWDLGRLYGFRKQPAPGTAHTPGNRGTGRP